MTTPQNPPLPSPPFYSIDNINNLRDAALFPTSPLRPSILFRSAEVSKLDRAGWDAVRSIGVAHVFDLRSKPEVIRGWAGTIGVSGEDVMPGWIETMQAAGIARTWTPVFEESDYSPERLAERYMKYMDESVQGFVDAYRDILRNGGPAYRTIFLYLAGLKEGVRGQGALVHCTAGKDRTGMFFGVLFDFLGIAREKIADEYQLTELGLRHVREDVVQRLLQSHGFMKYMLSLAKGKPLSSEEMAVLSGKSGEQNGAELVIPTEVQEKGRQAALRMIGARKESMLKALEMVDQEWGNSEGYMRKACGLGDEELNALRKNLIL